MDAVQRLVIAFLDSGVVMDVTRVWKHDRSSHEVLEVRFRFSLCQVELIRRSVLFWKQNKYSVHAASYTPLL